MGGEIAVESVPGLGSTFRFWVPAAPSPAALPAREGAAADLPAMPPARVLVAEDNPTNRHIIAAYLAMAGHAAEMVTDGAAALAAVGAGAFDLVIMDIQMPGMDGLTAAARIRALPGPAAGIPIIALTASAMADDRAQCLAAGMTDYVAKPVSLEALSAAVARSLGYSCGVSSTTDQPSPGSKLSMAEATSSVSSPRSAS
jgi:CheY-like chemotaxis protein